MLTHPRILRPLGQALLGFVFIALLSATVYTLLWWVDFGDRFGAPGPLALLRHPDAGETIRGLGEVTVAVLGIAITVVAIIVELAANRYTPTVTDLFVRDAFNQVVLSFFGITTILVVATGLSLGGPDYPQTMVTVVALMMAASLAALLPYFLYVFDFLSPTSIILRIQRRAVHALSRASSASEVHLDALRSEVKHGVEQLGEIAVNAVEKKDKGITIAALASLAEIAEASILARDELPDGWFETDTLAASDHDFVALHPRMLRATAQRRVWLEMKVFRQFQGVFTDSLHRMRDSGHLCATHTRNLAVLAAEARHPHAMGLAVRFMNTYLRSAISRRDVRSAYNLFNEYRGLAESLMLAQQHEMAAEIAERFKFYGQLSSSSGLPFILETAAFDLCALIERAHDVGSPSHDRMLDVFLEVDREPEDDEHQETSLRGVRKAQVKLATFYLQAGSEQFARRIFDDMRHESVPRLQSIRHELETLTDAEYWEVSDRGINFDYLPTKQREQLPTFFGWFASLE